MSELFQAIQKSIPPKQSDDYKENFQTAIRAVGGGQFIDKMNAIPSPIKRRKLIKKEQIKEDIIKENLIKVNDHWNELKFQVNWVNIEWVYPKKINSRKMEI